MIISIAISIINNNYVHYLYADPGFATATAICLFVFIFELLANTWSKSVIQSFYPFKWDGTIHLLHLIFLKKRSANVFVQSCMVGYLFTFFWWLDFISILSLLPDVYLVAKPMGIAKVSICTKLDVFIIG